MRTSCPKMSATKRFITPAFLTFVLIFFQAQKVHSALTLGTLNPPLQKIQTDDEGNTSSFELDPFVGYQFNFGTIPFWLRHDFVPEVGFVYHQVDVSSEYSKSSIYLLYELSWKLTGSLKLLLWSR